VTNYVESYLNKVISMVELVKDKSGDAIMAAAEVVADAIQNDKGYFTFGSGHSSLVAREPYWRAGGLAITLPIHDPMEGDAERLSGFAPIILARYDLTPGSAIVIISNSGLNPLPIEVAEICKARSLKVIAVTCLAQSKKSPSRHPKGKKLYEVADIVIDTQNEPGDTLMQLEGLPGKIGPISTLLGISIMDAISVQVTALLLERGITPPVLISSNIPEGDAHNKIIAESCRAKLIRLEIPGVDAK